MTKIAIVGGGAAGLICAASILENLHGEKIMITLFEKNPKLGVKVAISGGGRCNVTTGISDEKILLSKYIRGGDFLRPSLLAFPPEKMRDWLLLHGLPTKVEKDNRVFPVSDNGQDVIDLFERQFANSSIRINYRDNVTDIKNVSGGFEITALSGVYNFDILVITTGGNAYSHTGSSGDGYNFAKNLGHSVTKLGPSLNSFEVAEPLRSNFCKELSGISFPNCEFSFADKKSVSGAMLFTHFGISGPAVFALAAELAFDVVEKSRPKSVYFKPRASVGVEDWDKILTSHFSTLGTKQIGNSLTHFFPKSFVQKLLELANIDVEKKVSIISKDERRLIAKYLGQGIELLLTSRRAGDEFVTAGGVELKEVNRKTMESRIVPNLYFAGEILNIDGLTGGFNLQAAWSTGRAAAIAISKKVLVQ